jgi:serine/threonine-protein kinase ATR
MPPPPLSRAELIGNLLLEIDAVLRATAASGPAVTSAAEAEVRGTGGAGVPAAAMAVTTESSDADDANADSGGGAERLLCYQALFDVFDTLTEWLGQHRRRNELAEVAAIDALISRVSLLTLAQAALRAGAPCRAVRYTEQLADSKGLAPSDAPANSYFCGPQMRMRELPSSEAARLMHAAYLRLDESDGLLAVARLHASTTRSLADEALEHELHGCYSAALNCYQIALQASPPAALGGGGGCGVASSSSSAAAPVAEAQSRLPLQLGQCRSLRHLGLVGAMHDTAASALRSAGTAVERSRLLPWVALAAWRLGQWDEVRSCVHSSSTLAGTFERTLATSDDVYEIELARALLALHEGSADTLTAACRSARRALVPSIAAAGMDSYGRAYGSLVKLQVLQELETAAPLVLEARGVGWRGGPSTGGPLTGLLDVPVAAASAPLVGGRSHTEARHAVATLNGLLTLAEHWTKRSALVADSPQALEPLLSIRLAIVRMLADSCPLRVRDTPGLRAAIGRTQASLWLRLAKSARAAGHVETATQALAQAAVHDPYSACLIGAKMAWEAGTPHEAVLRLQQQVRTLSVLSPDALIEGSLRPVRELRIKTMLRLAHYLAEQTTDQEDIEISALHRKAVELSNQAPPTSFAGAAVAASTNGPSGVGAHAQAHIMSEKVYYRYGCFCERILERKLAAAKRTEVYSLGAVPGARSSLVKKKVTEVDRQRRQYEAYCKHLPEVLRNYGQSLQRGMRHASHALSRLITLWLEFSDVQAAVSEKPSDGAPPPPKADESHVIVQELTSTLPPFQWLPCVAQLVSRTTHRLQRARDLIHALLATLLATYPSQLSWAIVPASLSSVADRKRQGETILARAKQQMLGSGRSSEGLSTARRILDQLRKVCNDNSMEKREKHVRMSQRWASLFRAVELPLVIPTHAHLTPRAPEPARPMRHYEPYADDAVTIEKWDDGVEVMGSLQRPKKVTVTGSNGESFSFLCKPKDDLRKDARMMELMTAVNQMLLKSANCRRRKLGARCYAVVPLDLHASAHHGASPSPQVRAVTRSCRSTRSAASSSGSLTCFSFVRSSRTIGKHTSCPLITTPSRRATRPRTTTRPTGGANSPSSPSS